jgi:glucokinase
VTRYVAGVDIGATYTRVGLFTTDGMLMERVRFETPRAGGELAVASAVARAIEELLSRWGGSLISIGVGTVGPLDIASGDVTGAPNLPIGRFKVREPLERLFGVDVYVVNDCVAAAWAEYLVGTGRGFRNVVYVTLSTGIGGGAVVDGHLLLGKDGNAHEVGHIVLDLSGKFRCGCGGLGHWEAIASGANIPRTLEVLAREWVGEATEVYRKALDGGLSPEELFRLWRGGDRFAEFAVDFLAEVNAAGIASVVNVYDPEVLTLGGSIALRNPDFIKLSLARIGRYIVNRRPTILLTPLGDDVVLLGAAFIAIKPPRELLGVVRKYSRP